jgi:hypothetical protein
LSDTHTRAGASLAELEQWYSPRPPISLPPAFLLLEEIGLQHVFEEPVSDHVTMADFSMMKDCRTSKDVFAEQVKLPP